jgi:hypothetical protein
MPYTPGDNWAICDLSGKKVLMSQTRKTWDGLRVWAPLWYVKHPQLLVRGISERMAVPDARPRPADVYIQLPYGYGAFCLISPDGTYWTFWMDDDGALRPSNVLYGNPLSYIDIYSWRFTVDNDGALHLTQLTGIMTPQPWRMVSPGAVAYSLTVDTDGAVIVTAV